MAGKQHVMAGGEAAEDIVLDHVVGFVFKEQIAFVLINVQPQRANFLVLQGVDIAPNEGGSGRREAWH